MDRANGYILTLPQNWIILQLTEGDTEIVMAAAAEAFPDLQDTFELAALSSQGFRMMAFNTDPEYLALEDPPNLNVVIGELPASIPLEFIVRTNVQTLPQILPGAEILSSDLITNANGIPLGIIAYKFTLVGEDATSSTIVAKVAIFQIEDSFVIVTAGSSESVSAELEPDYDSIFDKIELIGS